MMPEDDRELIAAVNAAALKLSVELLRAKFRWWRRYQMQTLRIFFLGRV